MIDRQSYRLRSLGDFINTRGELVLLYGCPYVHTEEFLWRVEQLREMVSSAPADKDGEPASFEGMMSDGIFKQHVQRCLELHCITLGDVSLRQLQDLLLYEVVRDGGGNPELQPGLLVRINMPRTGTQVNRETTVDLGGDPDSSSYEKALAVIATHTKSVADAIELTRIMSVQQVTSYLEQSADIQRQISDLSGAAMVDSPGGSGAKDDLMVKLEKYC